MSGLEICSDAQLLGLTGCGFRKTRQSQKGVVPYISKERKSGSEVATKIHKNRMAWYDERADSPLRTKGFHLRSIELRRT